MSESVVSPDDDSRWEFWIDVGGTFTDCLARTPDGDIRAHKLLSSGIYRGRLASGSTRDVVRAADRSGDPPNFFAGFRWTLLTEDAGLGASSLVRSFDPSTGAIELETPLEAEPKEGQGYELASGEEAPVVGIRWLLGRPLGASIGAARVRLGTTRGTNALLERKGARTALVATRGFADALRIAYQNRPKLFDLNIRKPRELYEVALELDERIDSLGNVLAPLDRRRAREALGPLLDRGIRSLGVCLLNAYRNGEHEEIVREVALELGFDHVSLSSRIAPMQRLVDRGDTTVVDAYLTPILRDYVAGIRARLPLARLQLMTSAGSLSDADSFVGKDSVLSGPAGGVVGVARAATDAGFERAIGFDMGGTSTDVSRFDREYERRYVMEVNDPDSDAGVRVAAPMLWIETVAAGGGSTCRFDGQRTLVGPQSAGSDPGPACYGRGGPLCVTDVNLHLGRILPDRFALPLDRRAMIRRLDAIREEIRSATGKEYSRDDAAVGFLKVANANMAAAIRKVSLAKGYDVRQYVLVSFGGAGAQHACAIAADLGIRTILIHPYAGLLSAYGIGMAEVARFGQVHVGRDYSARAVAELEPVLDEMERDLRAQIAAEGIAEDRIAPGRRLLDLRYKGQEATMTVARPPSGDYAAAFEEEHRRAYGFVFPGRPIEIQTARLEVVGETRREQTASEPARTHSAPPDEWRTAFFGGEWMRTAVHFRERLRPGATIEGPAIVAEPNSTIVIEPGWRAERTARGDFVLRAEENPRGGPALARGGPALAPGGPAFAPAADLARPDPVELELFNNRFAQIAEQMGVSLQKTALSTNVKERLDFSCAVFTAEGDLVVNAPHIPVHLGAMGETVRRLAQDFPKMSPGDVYVTNDPYRGGSHLPDVTVVSPVFDAQGGEVLFFVGSRAHHAEIGGIVPGSMPPFSRSLAEEGVLLRAFRLVANERSSEEELRRVLSEAPYPSRCVEENLADIRAQVAANRTGAVLLAQLVERCGLACVRAYMGHIQRAAGEKMRGALARLGEGRRRFVDRLDNGAAIAVQIDIVQEEEGGRAVVDFEGTGPVADDNQNANPAIVRSAVLYAFRCLIDEDIPLNDGVLAPVQVRLPENCLLNPPSDPDPRRCPAVGGGNVETSQRIVDVVLGALGVAAASQGTMNNFLFGRGSSGGKGGFGYYETIGGGAGAGPDFDGASAVHTHMTNTRITDVEVFEARYPARIAELSIRRGSGGAGRRRGGDGMVREVHFLEALEVSLLTNRRRLAPYGQAGGEPGRPGRNLLLRSGSQTWETLEPAAQFRVGPGDVLRIETPGGGGFGAP